MARLTSVSHQYGDRHALQNMSLDLPAGCMVGLIGPDGVGKSTLLGLVAGARQLQQGQLEVLGGDMADSHFRSQVAPCIAYMPQGLGGNLYHTLTVDENIDFFADLFGLRGKARGEQIDRLLDATGLPDFRSRPAGKLSGGMKQKLGLCCALIHNPDLLILDEPTSGVDPSARNRFWQLLLRLSREDGVTIFISTHFMNEGERCDRISLMHAGEVLACDTPVALAEQAGVDNLEAAFMQTLEAVDKEPVSSNSGNVLGEDASDRPRYRRFSFQRLMAYGRRETRELLRDPIRMAFAFIGSALLMMETLGNIWNLGVKELRSIWHDKVLLAFVLMAFTLMVYTAGSAGSMELHNAPVAVVDEDQSALAGHMIDSLQPPWFMPPDQIQYGQIDEVLDKGSHTFVLVIPDGFERDIRQGRVTSVQLNIDATRMTQAFIGSRYIEQLLTTEVAEFMQTGSAGGAPPINLVTRVSFNPNLDGTWFGGVMELTNMISIILTGAALIREREHGTVEHLMVMPIKPFEIMAAKVWANGLVVMLAAILSVTLVIQQILDVPVQGSILLFMFGTLIHLFSTTAIGILIGTVARTMPQFGLLLILTILPL